MAEALPLLAIPRRLYRRMLDHCRSEWPQEACGMLIGRGAAVTLAVALRNASPAARTAFAIDPMDGHHIDRLLQEYRSELVAVYHSHPESVAYPSERDLGLAPAATAYHVIVSTLQRPPDVRAYRFDSGRAVPVPHRIVDEMDGAWLDLR